MGKKDKDERVEIVSLTGDEISTMLGMIATLDIEPSQSDDDVVALWYKARSLFKVKRNGFVNRVAFEIQLVD